MTMERKDALKILGFSSSEDPSTQEIIKAYRALALIHHPDRHSDKSEDEKKLEEEKFKELGAAYAVLTCKSAKEALILRDEYLDHINTTEDLLLFLHLAILDKQKDFLEKLLVKFKSGEGEKFGDYINCYSKQGLTALGTAICYGECSAEVVKLLLEYGADAKLHIGFRDFSPLKIGRAHV